MRFRSLLPTDTSGKLSLGLGLVVLMVGALFTLGGLGLLWTGNVAQVENSRLINRSYAALSGCGEAIALVGLVAGINSVFRKRQFSPAIIVGLILNLVALIMFLPASLALLLAGIFGLLEYFT